MDVRISYAVRECVAQCNDWNNPLPALNEYVDYLIEQGWEPADASEVGCKALRILDPQNPLFKNGDGMG